MSDEHGTPRRGTRLRTATRPRRTRLARSVLAALTVLAVLALLSATSGPAAAAAQVAHSPTAQAQMLQPQASQPQTVAVAIRDFAFAPANLTVHVGDTVAWINQDRAPHDVTSTGGPAAFRSPTLSRGSGYRHTFTVPGTYSYFCSLHPTMTGVITVVAHVQPDAVAPVQPPAPPPADQAPLAPAANPPAGPTSETDPAADPAAGARMPAPSPGTSADPAAWPAVDGPAPAAPAAPPPAPAPAPPAAQQVQETAPAAGGAQVRQLNPLLIVAGIAMGLATLCLLLISGQAAGAPSAAAAHAGGASRSGAGAGRAPTVGNAAAPAGTGERRHHSLSVILRLVAAAGLAVGAYVHFALAADYDAVGAMITQGMLFRAHGAAAALAGVAILLISHPRVYQVVLLTALSALFPVVLYTYVDVGALGPLPDMHEPVWYADKTISAIAEGVAALAAAGLLLARDRPAPA